MTHYSVQNCVQSHVTKLPTKATKIYIYKSEAEFEPILIQFIKLLCSNGKLVQLKATQL